MTEDLLHMFSEHEVLLPKVWLFIPLVLMSAQRSVFCMQDASSRTQQSNGPSAMRASMPTFTSAILKQTSKSVHNAGASSIHYGKKSSKHGDDNDIAALIAEVFLTCSYSPNLCKPAG
jgi:hypothetical protein